MLHLPEVYDEIRRLKAQFLQLGNEIARLNALIGSTPVLFTVTDPVFSHASQSFTEELVVTISVHSPVQAQIYYTDDGSAPTTASTLYTGPITITSTKTIRAIGVAPGYNNSNVIQRIYTFVATFDMMVLRSPYGPDTQLFGDTELSIEDLANDPEQNPGFPGGTTYYLGVTTIAGSRKPTPVPTEAVPEGEIFGYVYFVWPVAQGAPRAVDGFFLAPFPIAMAQSGILDVHAGNGWYADVVEFAGVPHYVFITENTFNIVNDFNSSIQV